MKDINDIFSNSLKKVAQTPGLRFDQPVFEQQTTAPAPKNTPASSPVVQNVKKPEVFEKTAPESPRIAGNEVRKLADILGDDLDSQMAYLRGIHSMIVSLGTSRQDSSLDSMKRMVEEAVTRNALIRKNLAGVRVI